MRSGTGDAVAQREERVNEVDVFEKDVRHRGRELHVREVPEPADAQLDEPVGQRLRNVLRHGEHGDVGVIFVDIVLQLIHRADGDVVDFGADKGGGDVEGGVNLEADLLEVEVLEQGMAEVAGTDDNQLVPIVDAQNVADFGAQFGDVIAVSLLAELTEAAQILPDLGGGDIHLAAEQTGRNAHDALVVEVVEIAVVARQTVDDSIRNFLLFHRRFRILHIGITGNSRH